MSSPIDRYVEELAARLPLPAHRLVHETRDHLHEARDRLVEEGLDPAAAERRAIEDLGDVDELLAAVSEDGSPVLSAQALRWIPWAALGLMLPTLFFVAVNVLEWAAGNDGGEGVFGSSLERWGGPVNALLTIGPFAALLLIVAAGARVRGARVERGFDLHVHLRLSWRLSLLALVCLLVGAGVAAYLLTESGVLVLPDSWDIW